MPIILLPKISRVFAQVIPPLINYYFLLMKSIRLSRTQNRSVRAVFLDIFKAFDKVWHDGLIFKLQQNGISGSLLKFFESYPHNRKQRIVLNGFFSDYSVIQSGVPQVSVLGQLLFLIYINDLGKYTNPISNFLLMIPCFFL